MEDKVVHIKKGSRIEKRVKRKRFFLGILLGVFFFVVIVIVYYNTSYSRVGSFIITGNEIMEVDDIKELSGIKDDDLFLIINTNDIEEILERREEISTATVKKNFLNTIDINIEEYEILGYVIENYRIFPVLTSGHILRSYELDSADNLPLFVNFGEEQLVMLVKELNELSSSLLNSISEIHHSPIERDPNGFYMYMNDGMKIVGTPKTIVNNFSYYPKLVSNIEEGVRGVFDMEVGISFRPYQ